MYLSQFGLKGEKGRWLQMHMQDAYPYRKISVVRHAPFNVDQVNIQRAGLVSTYGIPLPLVRVVFLLVLQG